VRGTGRFNTAVPRTVLRFTQSMSRGELRLPAGKFRVLQDDSPRAWRRWFTTTTSTCTYAQKGEEMSSRGSAGALST